MDKNHKNHSQMPKLNRRQASQWFGSPLKISGIVMIAVSFSVLQADYFQSTVHLGGYFVDSKDAAKDKEIYQSERIHLAAQKDQFNFRAAYGYSDLYDKRPNTYRNYNRLSIASLSYNLPGDHLKIAAGRDFLSLVDRSLNYDGGALNFKYSDLVQAELFGGYGVPSLYEKTIMDLDRDRALIGGRLNFTPFPFLLVGMDGLVNGRTDDGTIGMKAQGTVHDRLTLSGDAVFRRDSNAFSHAEASAMIKIREKDLFQIRYGMEDEQIDSSRYYNYFINSAHQFLMAGYTLPITPKLQLTADYGLVLYDNTTGHLGSMMVAFHGLFFKVGKDWETITDQLELKAGYSNLYWKKFRFDIAGGYSEYDLQIRKLDKKAYDFSVQPGYLIGKGFEISVAYEFLSNEVYKNDHRIFAGIKHGFFKSFPK